MSTVTLYPSGPPTGVDLGEAGAVVTNYGDGTVSYSDTAEPFVAEGTIAATATATLSGTQFFRATTGAVLGIAELDAGLGSEEAIRARLLAVEGGSAALAVRINARPVHSSDYASLAEAVDDAGGINGPQVVVGPGTHNIDGLILPTAGSTQTVGLKGQGYIVSRLKQTVDNGPGTYAVKAQNATGANQCTLEGLRVVGPNESFAYGAKACDMDGIRMSPRMNLVNCGANYFAGGVHMFGDHIVLDRCVIGLNYYNVRLGGSTTTGDLHFHACDLSAAAFASFGIVPGPQVVAGLQMFGGHVGFAPYVAYAETGIQGAGGNPTVMALLFNRTSFEACGNGVFYDEDAIGYFGQVTMQDVGAMNLHATYYLAGRGRPALYRLGGMRKWRWTNSNCSLGGPLADAMFSIANATSGFQDCIFDGVLEDMFRQYLLGPKPLFVSTPGTQSCYVKGTYEGPILRARAAVTAGRVCEHAQGQARHASIITTKNDLAGVSYNDAAIGECAVLLRRGHQAQVYSTDNVAADERFCLDPADPSKVARATTYPAETIVAASYAGGFASAPGLATVVLDVPAHRLQVDTTTIAPIDPALLAPLAWHKADALPVVADGTALASWLDSSGNGKTLVQATGAAQPTYRTAVQNGLPVVRFAGTDDLMAAVSAITAPRQVIVVAKYSAATFPGFHGLLSGLNSVSAELIMLGNGAASTVWFNDGALTTPYHKDGVALAESAMAAPMNAFAVMSMSCAQWIAMTLQVGQDRAFAGRNWIGDVAEIIVLGAVLTTNQRLGVEAWLKAKWATP